MPTGGGDDFAVAIEGFVTADEVETRIAGMWFVNGKASKTFSFGVS
jgi:hypothetical protein